jgi:hypothetical protein
MSKSTSLPYRAPFRYTRPASDLQAAFGAQTGNPPILIVENGSVGKAKKQSARVKKAAKSGAKAATAKTAKAKKPAPAPKGKKPANAAEKRIGKNKSVAKKR